MSSYQMRRAGDGWSLEVVRGDDGWRVEDACHAAEGAVMRIVLPPDPVASDRFDSPDDACEAGRRWLLSERRL